MCSYIKQNMREEYCYAVILFQVLHCNKFLIMLLDYVIDYFNINA